MIINENNIREEWKTIRGTHVEVNDEGEITKGPEKLKKIANTNSSKEVKSINNKLAPLGDKWGPKLSLHDEDPILNHIKDNPENFQSYSDRYGSKNYVDNKTGITYELYQDRRGKWWKSRKTTNEDREKARNSKSTEMNNYSNEKFVKSNNIRFSTTGNSSGGYRLSDGSQVATSSWSPDPRGRSKLYRIEVTSGPNKGKSAKGDRTDIINFLRKNPELIPDDGMSI